MTDSVDDLWASLQAEDAAARSKHKTKEKKISSAKRAGLKDAPVAKPKVVEDEKVSVVDKEITPETVGQHMHFHIRSCLGGNLGERKASLRKISRCPQFDSLDQLAVDHT